MNDKQIEPKIKTPKMPPVSDSDRAVIADFLYYLRVPLERTLSDHRALLLTDRSERLKGQVSYLRAQVSTLNWLIEINAQRKSDAKIPVAG